MVISWSSHGYIMVISWSYHGYIKVLYGYAMVISWSYHGYIKVLYGYAMVISWSYHGHIMVIYGYTMVISWLYHGLSWFIMVISWLYHGLSSFCSDQSCCFFVAKPFFSTPFWNPAVLSLGSQGWASSGLHCSWEFCEGANVWDLQVSSVFFRTVPDETCTN